MSDETTPAVERGVKAFMWADETGTAGGTVRDILLAVLTDDEDPDYLARTLYVVDKVTKGYTADESDDRWRTATPATIRAHWREVADGLRKAILGSD